ncbi:hypothetical protein AAFF_G00060680 [Aldrovandia affinis]|uniref:Uncharacterized protein n=1 Tax=Aldrovandia affinis TaxID=143900 RepID=A0AAD7RZQ2_9TELE|nr:hypothetical protein AAFF_G00060680 [Aldrovandia affinis]
MDRGEKLARILLPCPVAKHPAEIKRPHPAARQTCRILPLAPAISQRSEPAAVRSPADRAFQWKQADTRKWDSSLPTTPARFPGTAHSAAEMILRRTTCGPDCFTGQARRGT